MREFSIMEKLCTFIGVVVTKSQTIYLKSVHFIEYKLYVFFLKYYLSTGFQNITTVVESI